jgi:hypothetical protein
MYSSPNIDRGRIMRWAGHAASIDAQNIYTNYGWKSSREVSTWK